jgi:hypothetical protein
MRDVMMGVHEKFTRERERDRGTSLGEYSP